MIIIRAKVNKEQDQFEWFSVENLSDYAIYAILANLNCLYYF